MKRQVRWITDSTDLQHAIFVLLLKGQLARSPIKEPQRVLDIGTGTGIWAIEFGMSHTREPTSPPLHSFPHCRHPILFFTLARPT